MLDLSLASRLKRDEAGLVCAVVQSEATGRVLMVGYMNDEAVARTLTCGLVTFWSRSRGRLWQKGETSGNFLEVTGVELDCDGDALLVRVRPHGPTCHTGEESCFDAGGVIPHDGRGAGSTKDALSIGEEGGGYDGP